MNRGSSLAVIGPNGAGKTVLSRAPIGALPFGGLVQWASGVRIGYVPQKFDLDRDVPISVTTRGFQLPDSPRQRPQFLPCLRSLRWRRSRLSR